MKFCLSSELWICTVSKKFGCKVCDILIIIGHAQIGEKYSYTKEETFHFGTRYFYLFLIKNLGRIKGLKTIHTMNSAIGKILKQSKNFPV